jgi:hypothetical protein
MGMARTWLLPCPMMLLLAACFWRPGSPVADGVADVGPWTVSASSPVDREGDRAAPSGAPAAEPALPLPGTAHAAEESEAAAARGGPSAAGETSGSLPGDDGGRRQDSAGARNDAEGGARADAPPSPAGGAPSAGDGSDLSRLSLAEQVHTLRAELRVERQRRQSAELQLQRLKEETSVPPFGSPMVPEREMLAAKQEIVYLRQSLEEERAERQRLAEELLALQTRVAQASAPDDQELLARQKAAAASFTHSFSTGQAESSALDDRLAAAAKSSDLDDIRSENAALRSRLEEQHRRTQELGEKLKVATRVADLIFKLEAQPSADGLPPRPAPKPAARRAAARPQAAAPRSAPPAPPLPYAELDDSSGYDPEPPDTPTPRLQPTPTPTMTPRLVSTPSPTPTTPKHAPAPPAMPVRA